MSRVYKPNVPDSFQGFSGIPGRCRGGLIVNDSGIAAAATTSIYTCPRPAAHLHRVRNRVRSWFRCRTKDGAPARTRLYSEAQDEWGRFEMI